MSRVAVYVIPTDEELMIAQHTLAAIAARGPVREDGQSPGLSFAAAIAQPNASTGETISFEEGASN